MKYFFDFFTHVMEVGLRCSARRTGTLDVGYGREEGPCDDARTSAVPWGRKRGREKCSRMALGAQVQVGMLCV